MDDDNNKETDKEIDNPVEGEAPEAATASESALNDDAAFDKTGEIEDISSSSIFHVSSNTASDVKDKKIAGIESIDLDVKVVIGKAKIAMKKILVMEEGAIIELDKKIGEDMEIYVNESLVARGEIVIIDHNIGVAITTVLK